MIFGKQEVVCGVREIAVVHRPFPQFYLISLCLPPSSTSQFFFFILTLIECREIKNTSHYGGEPALHIVELAVMNCPSGPFRSEFLLSHSFSLCARLQLGYGEGEKKVSLSIPRACSSLLYPSSLRQVAACPSLPTPRRPSEVPAERNISTKHVAKAAR